MASTTKEALGAALRQMMTVKPIDKITVKDLVEICGVNRQTFYYHFDDVYDLLEWVFEDDANRVLPRKVVYEHWREDVMVFFEYLYENRIFAMNVYNSNSRLYMLRYFKDCLISQWLDMGMSLPKEITKDRFLRILDNSVENMLARFRNN